MIGAILAICAVVGAVVSYVSTSDTNRTNQRISEETNRANLKNYNQQRAYDREMYNQQVEDNVAFWNMQNEYNSYENQIARAREAGINPSFVIGGSDTAGSINSASYSSTPVPQMQGYQYQSPFGSAMNGLMQMLPMVSGLMNDESLRGLQGSQTEQTNMFTPLIAEGMSLDNASKKVVNSWQPKMLEQDYTSKWLKNWYDERTMFSRVQQQFHNEAQAKAQQRIATMQSENMEKLQRFVEPQALVDFMTQVEELAYIKSNKLVNYATFNKLVSETAKNYATISNINADTQNKQDEHDLFVSTKDALVDKASADASTAQSNAEKLKQVINSEIERINSENKLQTIINDSDVDYLLNFPGADYIRKSKKYGGTFRFSTPKSLKLGPIEIERPYWEYSF